MQKKIISTSEKNIGKIKQDRLDFINFYSDKIKQDKKQKWRKEQKAFIDAQINNANKFYIRLILSENGIKKFQRTTKASDKFTQDFYEYAKQQK